MNSCLYKALIMHNRLSPKKHRFHYNVFMFYIDLDELEFLSKKFLLISRNRFNFFNFKDSEHLQLPIANPDKSKPIKHHITEYLKQNGINIGSGKIILLTNLNVLGYNFNPVVPTAPGFFCFGHYVFVGVYNCQVFFVFKWT